jgi:hypothetical protein
MPSRVPPVPPHRSLPPKHQRFARAFKAATAIVAILATIAMATAVIKALTATEAKRYRRPGPPDHTTAVTPLGTAMRMPVPTIAPPVSLPPPACAGAPSTAPVAPAALPDDALTTLVAERANLRAKPDIDVYRRIEGHMRIIALTHIAMIGASTTPPAGVSHWQEELEATDQLQDDEYRATRIAAYGDLAGRIARELAGRSLTPPVDNTWPINSTRSDERSDPLEITRNAAVVILLSYGSYFGGSARHAQTTPSAESCAELLDPDGHVVRQIEEGYRRIWELLRSVETSGVRRSPAAMKDIAQAHATAIRTARNSYDRIAAHIEAATGALLLIARTNRPVTEPAGPPKQA